MAFYLATSDTADPGTFAYTPITAVIKITVPPTLTEEI